MDEPSSRQLTRQPSSFAVTTMTWYSVRTRLVTKSQRTSGTLASSLVDMPRDFSPPTTSSGTSKLTSPGKKSEKRFDVWHAEAF